MWGPRDDDKKPFTALILAAGDSLRMGEPKATLEISRQPAWLRLARISLGAGATKVLILVASDVEAKVHDRMPLSTDNPRMMPVVVPEKLRRRGPIGSILAGIQSAEAEAEGWLLWPVDHPFVAADTIRALARGTGLIRMPIRRGRRGHPLFLRGRAGADIVDLIDQGGTMREYVSRHIDDVENIEVDDEAIHWNCDSPAAFRRYLEAFEEARRKAGPTMGH